MTLVLADRVRDTTTTTGTGTITLSGTAPTGYQTFDAGIGNTNTTYYTINAGSQWEVGLGTYSSIGPTLTRDTVLSSSNGGALVNFDVGTKDVFVTYPADKSVYQDSSGDVGIGTSSPEYKLQVAGSLAAGRDTNQHISLTGDGGSNAITGVSAAVNPKPLLIATDANSASLTMNVSGSHEMRFATSNTERMRISSGGNVGIGTSSPISNATLHLASTSPIVYIEETDQALDGKKWRCVVNAGTMSFQTVNDAVSVATNAYQIARGTGTAIDRHIFFTGLSSERMRIDSSGKVGIGTSVGFEGSLTLSDYLQVRRNSDGWLLKHQRTDNSRQLGLYVSGHSDPSLDFYINNAEQMRISSDGNVGIGTSSPSFQLQLSTDSAAKPSSALWTIASDSRIKNEIGEYTKGLDAVCALRPVTYTYNGAAGFTADGRENISIIAQEAMRHFPECVGTYSAKMREDDEEDTELYNWNGHALVFALVNAVKELKAHNEDLRARVAQLEGN